MCSGPIFLPSFLNSTLSKYLKLPVVTLTAPTLSRRLQIVDAVEIDQPLQRLAQRRGVVIALRLRAALRPQRRRRKARGEEAGHAEGRDQGRAGLVENRCAPRSPWTIGFHGTGDDTISQNSLSRVDALVRRVAGDDRGIDGADRDAGDPFGLEIDGAQRLIGAGLIGAERAAALQNQHTLRLRGASLAGAGLEISVMTVGIKYQKRMHRGDSSRAVNQRDDPGSR